MAVAQDLDVAIADHLAQLAFRHPVMLGDLFQGQRRVAGTGEDEAGGWGAAIRASPPLVAGKGKYMSRLAPARKPDLPIRQSGF